MNQYLDAVVRKVSREQAGVLLDVLDGREKLIIAQERHELRISAGRTNVRKSQDPRFEWFGVRGINSGFLQGEGII